jgi:hypothetical protein
MYETLNSEGRTCVHAIGFRPRLPLSCSHVQRGVEVLGFRVDGLGFGVLGLGFRSTDRMNKELLLSVWATPRAKDPHLLLIGRS